MANQPFQFQVPALCPVDLLILDKGLVTLNVRAHNLATLIQPWLCGHHKSGGNQCRLGGMGDAKGQVIADFDLNSPPWNDPPGIQPGKPVEIFWHYAPTQSIRVPMRIVQLHQESVVEGGTVVRYDFSAEMDADAGTFLWVSGLPE